MFRPLLKETMISIEGANTKLIEKTSLGTRSWLLLKISEKKTTYKDENEKA